MNFQQLRSTREAARRGFNLTEVASVLHTSQPGVSRQIRELEAEFGVPLFTRSGKRLTGMTDAGLRMLPIIERMLDNADSLRRAGLDFTRELSGRLAIAATHSQARYALPHAVYDFRLGHPAVQLELHQGSPQQVAALLLEGVADIGIATEGLADYPGLVTLPCYQWTHVVLVPHGHPLADGQPLTLQRLVAFPLISYETGFTGRSNIDRAFQREGLAPHWSVEAMDADVIKTYVELGLGVGIIAAIAHQPERDLGLVALDARHLFPANLTRLAVRRGEVLRDIAYEFIRAFASPLTREVVDEALEGPRPAMSRTHRPPLPARVRA
ncbi:CysB family HTH-type transcriptional regulator [Ideonella alba]|uniref:CysB family HTH-type transcriptional regulator n=1 Tax=Ideonella alba TaxID=2824118 RepID=A0A940Y9K2_9BURK|nr:CysB family HTH-type transcriptional regulator [Ideonella alba]MBQ0928871.1 CysB family HTH-type transcriptional regulator [Ideonella alba]